MIHHINAILRRTTWMHAALGFLCAGLVIQYTYQGDRLQISLLEPIGYWVLTVALWLDPKGLRMKRSFSSWWILLWFLLGGWMIAQWLAADQWQAKDIREVRTIFLPLLLGGLFLCNRSWHTNMVMRFLSVSLILSSVVAIGMAVTGWWNPPFAIVIHKELWNPLTETGGRVAVGLFQNPNVYAGFLYWPILYLAAGLKVPRSLRDFILLCVFLLCITGLILSLARGVWIGAMAALLWAGWVSRSPHPRRLAIGLIVWMAVGAGLFCWAWWFAPQEGFFLSLGYRQEYWQASIAFYLQNPCMLWGGSSACALTGVGDVFTYIPEDPHNLYLYMISHYGIAGLCLMVSTLGLLIWQGWRKYQRGWMAAHPFSKAIWAGWLVFPFIAILDSYFTTLEYRVLFFMMVAITFRDDGWAPLQNSSSSIEKLNVTE
jgi:O-antigen ligase